MTVQELIDALQAIEDKTVRVLISKDPEGNGFWNVDRIVTAYLDGSDLYVDDGSETLEHNAIVLYVDHPFYYG